MTDSAMRDITPPPPIPTVARKGSHPSLTHSSAGTSDDHAHSPIELLVTPVGLGQMQEAAIRRGSESREDGSSASGDDSAPRGRTLKGRFGTRSMSNIKSKPPTSPAPPLPKSASRPGTGRERAMTLAATDKIASHPVPMPATKQAKSGGFSSFIRKLTGKQPKKPAVANPMDVLNRPDAPFRPVHLPDPPAARKPALPPLDLNRLPPGAAAAGPQTAPAGTLNRAPLSAYPVMEPTSVASKPIPLSEEPTEIPLPPSPETAMDDALGEFGARPPAPAPSRSTKRTTQLVSMPEFEVEDEEELEDEDEDDEVAELVRPLAVRIPSATASAPSPAPISATSTTSNRTSVLSPRENPFEASDDGKAPSSPRRVVVPEPARDLDRKTSKWRKTVTTSTLDRRTSQRPAPIAAQSYDSYTSTSYRGPPPAGSHARRQANRTSCAPTMHSTASVAASLRAIQNKEQADMAESFFLS